MSQVVCFEGKFLCRNPHKEGSGYGKSNLGGVDAVLGDVAEDMIQRLRDADPSLIADQILRVDFFRDTKSGRYILNEVEGFNAQVVGMRSGDGAGNAMNLAKIYWREQTKSLVKYHLNN